MVNLTSIRDFPWVFDVEMILWLCGDGVFVDLAFNGL